MNYLEKMLNLEEKYKVGFYHPQEYATDSVEYAKLQLVAAILTAQTKIKCWVESTYFDYYQNRLWTTIIADDGCEYQLLNPLEQGIILCDDLRALADVVECLTEHLCEK